MKLLKSVALMALLTACCMHASAQEPVLPINEPNYNKPKLFADLPDKLPLRLAELESLFNLPVGTKVTATVANGFPLAGTVVSKSDASDTAVKSIVINSLTRQGATFTFTRVTAADGSVSYLGRMLSKANGDALEIAKEGNQYIIRKKSLYDLISE